MKAWRCIGKKSRFAQQIGKGDSAEAAAVSPEKISAIHVFQALVDKNEFIRIQKQTAKIRKTLTRQVGRKSGEFARIGPALER